MVIVVILSWIVELCSQLTQSAHVEDAPLVQLVSFLAKALKTAPAI